MSVQDYRSLHNEELIDLFFTQEDRLPREAIDEIVRRGAEMVPILSDIVMDRVLWTADLPDWWAPVHATYTLGAIGGLEVTIPLMASIRWSDAYDNDWVTEDLPSILGSLGEKAIPQIISCVQDRSAGWSARSIAMDALGSIALRKPEREEELMALLGAILRDAGEEHGARRSAAFVLLDFRRSDYRKELLALAESEVRWQRQYPDYRVAFSADDVKRDLATPRCAMDIYIRDWMEFYDPQEIMRRQQRWSAKTTRHRGEAPAAQSEVQDAVTRMRNSPCPCGSGKPYKRCCLNKLH